MKKKLVNKTPIVHENIFGEIFNIGDSVKLIDNITEEKEIKFLESRNISLRNWLNVIMIFPIDVKINSFYNDDVAILDKQVTQLSGGLTEYVTIDMLTKQL